MSEEDLELLLTLDDPGEEEDALNHLQDESKVIANGPYPVVFGEGDWTCAVSRMTVTANDSVGSLHGTMLQPANQGFEIEVCVITCSKQGEVVERKVFYDLVGMQRQIEVR